MADALQEAYERARRYLDALGERPVRPDHDGVSALTELGGSLPAAATDPVEVVRLLDEFGTPATMAISGPRFFGFVMGGSLPVATAASWLSTAWDQNTGLHFATPGTAAIEEYAHAWLLDVLELPAECGTGFVTGGTMANFTALAAARHALYKRAGWDVEADGMIGAPPITVVLGAEAHPTVRKSLGMLGFGRTTALEVPVDDQGRMRADALPDVKGLALVITQAGNVNTGSFDPIGDVCAWARERGAWVHVDGAFGLWAAAAPARKHLLAGYEQADSWATDAHKWLNVPYDSGVAFVRDGEALRSAMAISAAYLPAEDRREPAHYTPELSRRARGVEVWAALKSLGRSGVADMIERCCAHATRFADRLGDAGYEILNDVVLNQVLVSFGDADATTRTIAAIQEDGTCWAGGTVWQGRTAMRISVSNWSTTTADVDSSVDAMIRCARAAARP
jgi:glutamate/tyrosine decarboxylase-like PLP-dependent enzyme